MRTLHVSFGGQHPARIVSERGYAWPDFAAWLTACPEEKPSKDSDGWYIPAKFDPVYRDSENFGHRDAITYDFDHVSAATWDDVLSAWGNTAFALYTTYSHTSERPRFRVVMPLSRPTAYDEFQAVARKVAVDVGIEMIARESFVPAQMMFCPARPPGGPHSSLINDGEWLNVDAVLSEYEDWAEVNSWPRRRDGDAVHAVGGEKVDPREKPGIIGEFNRAFTISQAIERFELPYRRVR